MSGTTRNDSREFVFKRENAAFDKQTYTFRVDYDDGDVEVAFKPWMESVWLEPR